MATKVPSLPYNVASMSHGRDSKQLIMVVAELCRVGHCVIRLLS